MNYGLIPVSVCKTPYRESENLEGRQLLVAVFLPFLRSLCYLIGYSHFMVTNINLQLFFLCKCIICLLYRFLGSPFQGSRLSQIIQYLRQCFITESGAVFILLP